MSVTSIDRPLDVYKTGDSPNQTDLQSAQLPVDFACTAVKYGRHQFHPLIDCSTSTTLTLSGSQATTREYEDMHMHDPSMLETLHVNGR